MHFKFMRGGLCRHTPLERVECNLIFHLPSGDRMEGEGRISADLEMKIMPG